MTNRKLTLEEFFKLNDLVNKEREEYPSLREGQTWFNVLVEEIPEFECVRTTKLDPFFRDEVLLDLFYQILEPEAYEFWRQTDYYAELFGRYAATQKDPTPVDVEGSELSDFVESEFDPQNNNITQSILVESLDWRKALEEALVADGKRLIDERKIAEMKDKENAKAIESVYVTPQTTGLVYAGEYNPINSVTKTSPQEQYVSESTRVSLRFTTKLDMDKTFLLVRDLLATNPAAELKLDSFEINRW